MALPSQATLKPLFEFNLSSKAAQKSYFLLKHKFGGNITIALLAQQDSPLGYESEFKPVQTLKQIFGRHPSWEQMKSVLSLGLQWPLAPLDESARVKDVDKVIKFGNHNGAVQQDKLLQKLVKDDVERGFTIPLPIRKISLIPGVLLAPLNIQEQSTINKQCKIIPKIDLLMTKVGNCSQGHQ
jgi:hypothetical protein